MDQSKGKKNSRNQKGSNHNDSFRGPKKFPQESQFEKTNIETGKHQQLEVSYETNKYIYQAGKKKKKKGYTSLQRLPTIIIQKDTLLLKNRN